MAYYLMERQGQANPLHRAGALFQEWTVIQWAKVEEHPSPYLYLYVFVCILCECEGVCWHLCYASLRPTRAIFLCIQISGSKGARQKRLLYIRLNQAKLRVAQFDEVRALSDLANQPAGAVLTHGVGRPMVLASSFVGGPRYNRQLYYDGMAIVRKQGKADLFITFTANATWPEVKAALNASGGGCTPQERYDIISRVFKLKLAQLMADLKAGMLGPMAAFLMVVEWQKRGLPHAHILLFFLAIARLRCVADYDELVSAEIPDPEQEPELHDAVMSYMLHGPCGGFNLKCPCMKDNKCSKKFPKALRDDTGDDEDGFPLYRRRVIANALRGYQHPKYGDMVFDNTWVVPYIQSGFAQAVSKPLQCGGVQYLACG
jgi:hypothetical protein